MPFIVRTFCALALTSFLAAAATAAPALDILSDRDARAYARIFELQDKGDFKAADRLVRSLENKLLMGHVRFQRYMHPTAYKSSFPELRNWMARYSDHPEAYRAFALAMRRKPKNAKTPKKPVYGQEHILALVGEPPPKPAPFVGREESIADKIKRQVRKGRNDAAIKLLRQKSARRTLSTLQQDVLAAQIAMGYFVDGKDVQAYRIAAAAAKRSGSTVGQAHWVAGLAAYRSGWIERAIPHFEQNAITPGATSWTASAGAFWAGRVHLALGDVANARKWLSVAAQNFRTFYGQLALHALEAATPFDWRQPPVEPADLGRLRATKGGLRALALLQAGQRWRADQELQPLVDDAEPILLRSILATALAYRAPRAAVQAAFRLREEAGAFVAAGFYPEPPWPPPPDYKVDRALAFAFMRQESQFNPRAVSFAGARGLMQVLPTTANYALGEKRYVGAKRDGLFDPVQNVAVGVRYLRYLMGKGAVGDGLFQLAIAYNAGIGNLIRWKREVKDNGDPLLFIEAIPSRETRVFVERVMANMWIYRDQLGQKAFSRDDVALGRWPAYREQD